MTTPPPAPQNASSSPQTDAKGSMNAGRIAAVGAAVLCIGSFLPWVSATTVFGTISLSGTDGDGVFTAVIGAVAAVVLYLASTKAQRSGFTVGAALGVVGGLIAGSSFSNVSDSVSEGSSEYVVGRVGVGLYLCVGGAIATVIASLVARSKAAAETPRTITFPDAPPASE